MMVPGVKPYTNTADMTEDEIFEIEQQEVPMVEVDAPITWLETLVKMVLFGCFMGLFILLSIWTGQEGMLYVPA